VIEAGAQCSGLIQGVISLSRPFKQRVICIKRCNALIGFVALLVAIVVSAQTPINIKTWLGLRSIFQESCGKSQSRAALGKVRHLL
jgi:hypothetical protein